MDRPSITLGKFGTVGLASPLRAFEPHMQDTEVKLSVYAPPSGPINPLYKRYLEADLNNPGFRNIFLDSLMHSPELSGIQLGGDYGEGTGKDLIDAILADPTLRTVEIPGLDVESRPFQFRDALGRRETLRVMLAEASFHVTNAMVISEQLGFIPVTDDPYMTQLLDLRASNPGYVGGIAPATPWLGMEVATAAIPDAALEKLNYTDILEYRSSAKDAYRAWFTELNRIAAELDEMSPSEIAKELPRIKAQQLSPRVVEYGNEMKAIADKLYGDLIKAVVQYPIPTLSVAYCLDLSISKAMVAFAGALTPAIPAVIDYIQASRAAKRKHGIGYLIGLRNQAGV